MSLLLLTLLAAAPIERAQAEADFRAANERALEGDLPGAIALYETLIEGGIVDADVFYNLGNAKAQSGDEIGAIVAYERALRLTPGNAETLANLRFVRQETEAEVGGSLNAADAIEPMIAHLPLEPFAWGAGVSNLLLFGFLLLRRRRRRRWILGVIVLAALTFAASSAIVAGHYVVAADPRGVLVKASPLREGPHPKFKSKGPATLGGRVRVLDQAEGFLKVLQQDGTTGWVPLQAVTRV